MGANLPATPPLNNHSVICGNYVDWHMDLQFRDAQGKLAEGMPACTGCHSPDGVGNEPAAFPHLGGQHAAYVAKQLTAFREGERTNDGDSMIMRSIAAKLSNKDIAAVSSYIEGLH